MFQVAQANRASEITFIGTILGSGSKRHVSVVDDRLSAKFLVTDALEIRAWVTTSLASRVDYSLAINPVHRGMIDVGDTSKSSATGRNSIKSAHARSPVVSVYGQLR